MSNDPEEIRRREIEATRAGLSDDVNALSDKVSPGQIAKRQRDRLMGTAQSVKDSIMGSADDAKSSASEAMSTVGDAVSGAPSAVAERTKGSPLAAGLVAFGAGLLVSSLFPASRRSAGRGSGQGAGSAPGRRRELRGEGSRREPAGAGAAGIGIGEVHRHRRRGHRQGTRCQRGRGHQGPRPGRQGNGAAAGRQLSNLIEAAGPGRHRQVPLLVSA